MGLIKAALSSVSSSLSDTWKDYFVCESLPANVLMIKGEKKGKGLFDKGDVITNGSGIVVNEGQCAIIVDDGVVVEVAAEPGNYTFDTTKSPSIFVGGLGEALKQTFNTMIERFTYGGVTNRSQYVYYINTKELFGNMYGTASPVPFKVVDESINLNMQVMLKCNGEYSVKITNPILFYKNVAGNTDVFYKDNLDNQMRSEVLTALAPALADLSNKGVKMYSDIPFHNFELTESMNKILSSKWAENRGIEIGTFAINAIVPRDEDMAKIQNLQEAAALRDPNAAASALAAAQAQAMRDAANNPNGAMNGFVGLNMANGAGNTISNLYAQGQAQAPQAAMMYCPNCGKQISAEANFCQYCGKAVK